MHLSKPQPDVVAINLILSLVLFSRLAAMKIFVHRIPSITGIGSTWPHRLATFSIKPCCLPSGSNFQQISTTTLHKTGDTSCRAAALCTYHKHRTLGVQHYSCSSHHGVKAFQCIKCKLQSKVLGITRECSSSVIDDGDRLSWKILFFGTDYFSLTCLQTLFQNR